MLKSIKSTYHLLRFRNYCPFPRCSRTFLSDSYNCTEVWNHRHETPLLQKVNTSNLYFELEQTLQSTGRISAVDVDIYVNAAKDPEAVDEVVNILYQLRLSAATIDTLDSTHHALIRYLLDRGEQQLLCEILHDRFNYGIFPDHYCYNLMMNKFLIEKDFASAAKIAVLLMLQEDAEHDISNNLAIYSCYQFMENPDGWTLPAPPAVDPTEDEIKVRVHYLRNPYFDDHFDLVDPKHLVGKTLVFFGKIIDDSLGRTCVLAGYISWMKYKEAVDILKSWIDQGTCEIVYKAVLPLIEKEISKIPEDKITDDIVELKSLLVKLGTSSLKDGSVLEEMEERIKKVVAEKETADIENQCQIYKDWEINRMNLLEKQLKELDMKERLENVEKIKCNLVERERLLTFFEKEEEIELRIERKLKMEEEKYGPKVEVNTEIDENYIPPEITKRRPSSQN